MSSFVCMMVGVCFILLGIVLLRLGLVHLAESRSCFNGNEEEAIRISDDQIGSTSRSRRHGACAFCGNLSSTSSVKCQILHWRSVHKFECLENTKKENSEVGEIESVHKSRRQPNDASGGEAFSDTYTCAVCGGLASTRCSRCKAVGLLSNSSEEEDHHDSPSPISLEFYPEGTTNTKPLIRSFQEPTKKAQDHVMEGTRCLEEEVAKSRNEVILLQSECEKWAMRANIAKQRYQSFKKESEHQLFVLKNEKELITKAEAQAQNMVNSLYERLHNLQITIKESIAENRKQEEYIQMLESTCARLKKELQEERVHVQELIVERDESYKIAQIAMREVEAKGKELQGARECVQQLKEDFHRDVTTAESRAVIAEEKLRDLDRKIRLKNDKVLVWTDSLGRPAMVTRNMAFITCLGRSYRACAICLTNENDLAFGCGHMTCRDCGSKISKCPICREQITSLVRLFPG
ncbi:Nuclear-pore anchor [Senna tora]|uniref:Nuclear-pore anchor n=1 Tax=Senna tora TaxID=362788 RepID=A0A834TIM7_9FABA|nr:Nuclear-pore anchor [Senna tora]